MSGIIVVTVWSSVSMTLGGTAASGAGPGGGIGGAGQGSGAGGRAGPGSGAGGGEGAGGGRCVAGPVWRGTEGGCERLPAGRLCGCEEADANTAAAGVSDGARGAGSPEGPPEVTIDAPVYNKETPDEQPEAAVLLHGETKAQKVRRRPKVHSAWHGNQTIFFYAGMSTPSTATKTQYRLLQSHAALP